MDKPKYYCRHPHYAAFLTEEERNEHESECKFAPNTEPTRAVTKDEKVDVWQNGRN